jgi:hypothetical protein
MSNVLILIKTSWGSGSYKKVFNVRNLFNVQTYNIIEQNKEIMNEVRWQNGQDRYDRSEIESMLETQRAMALNDMKYYFIKEAENKGLKGKLTQEANDALEVLANMRKVVF